MSTILLHCLPNPDVRSEVDLLVDLMITPTTERVSRALEAGIYKVVAIIDSDDRDLIFAQTQNGILVESWSRTPPDGITVAGSGLREGLSCRSTSVGDLMISDGQVMAVANIDFTPIDCDVDLGNLATFSGEPFIAPLLPDQGAGASF